MAKILVVEDDLETLNALKRLLQTERHSVDCTESAMEALDFIKTYTYDVLMVDWEMPGMSGIDLIKEYRINGGSAPVIMLTGRTATPDKISGLDSGADYYLTKPYNRQTVLGFIRASMRRAPAEESAVIALANLQLNAAAAQATCEGNSVVLSTKELAVLELLIKQCRRIITHEEIRKTGWPEDPDTPPGTVRVFLTGLREKLQSVGARIRILNVRGYGYRVEATDNQ